MLASPALWLEYEAVLKRPKITNLHGLNAESVDDFLDAMAIVVEPVHIRYIWRPQLNDPKDEMVLETAVNGCADVLVTFNNVDFASAMPLFSPSLQTPGQFLPCLVNRNDPSFRKYP